MLNFGPTHDGRIIPVFEERLRQIGSWLKVNGEALYSSRPWRFQNDTVTQGIWYTSKKSAAGTMLYAITLNWPTDGQLLLGAVVPKPGAKVTLLGYKGVELNWTQKKGSGMLITWPVIPYNKIPCDWAWTLKIENLL